jgi:hypothetical protein
VTDHGDAREPQPIEPSWAHLGRKLKRRDRHKTRNWVAASAGHAITARHFIPPGKDARMLWLVFIAVLLVVESVDHHRR